MSSYSKMVVLPQEEYLQLKSMKNAQQPIVNQLQELTKKDEEIEKISDPYRRLQLHADNIEERRNIRDKMRKFITLSTPRQYRSRAENLLNFIEPFIHYNERGEILDSEKGEAIKDSHIDDLLQHAVRDMRRKMVKPNGWDHFREILSRENVPHNIIGAPTISELSKHSTTRPKMKVPRKMKIKDEVLDDESANVKHRRTRSYDKSYSKY